MNKMVLMIGIFGTMLALIGATKIPNNNSSNENNELMIKYYLGMTFPKYQHPAKLYDEIDKSTVDKMLENKDSTSYYMGFYRGNTLMKFEKYLNHQKVFEFKYKYDEKGKLIEFDKRTYD